jgi:acyl carrier protein
MKERVLEIMRKVTPKMSAYNGEHLLDDIGLDSFDIISLISELEQAFSIEFEVDDVQAENFQTLDTVVDLVQRKVNG